MNNSNYSSLVDSLIQNGIISSNQDEQLDKNIENPFKKDEGLNLEASSNKETEIEIPEALLKKSKRLNQSDFEMISGNTEENPDTSSFKIIKRFLNIKQNLAHKGALGNIENFLFAFFPRLYKAKLARDAMLKLKELNIDTNKLLDKTIPYGESEIRYQNLIKYLNYANEIQTKIKRKTL